MSDIIAWAWPAKNPGIARFVITQDSAKALAAERRGEEVTALRAASIPTQPEGVRVKPLEWKIHGGIASAKSPVGFYAVRDGYIAVFRDGTKFGDAGSLSDGQAKCQADYEQRIRSTLTPSSTNGGGVTVTDEMADAGLAKSRDKSLDTLTNTEAMRQIIIAALKAEEDAARYRFLRERDLDTIKGGGVFAGMTPDNVVLNGEDLDAAIDAARAFVKGSSNSREKGE
mgnify:CR=1 FL=1